MRGSSLRELSLSFTPFPLPFHSHVLADDGEGAGRRAGGRACKRASGPYSSCFLPSQRRPRTDGAAAKAEHNELEATTPPPREAPLLSESNFQIGLRVRDVRYVAFVVCFFVL